MKSHSPEEIFHSLDEHEKLAFLSWKEKRLFLVQKRVKDEVEAEIEGDHSLMRQSVPFIRVKVGSMQKSAFPLSMRDEALLTIWQPKEEQLDLLNEGHAIEIRHISVRNALFNGVLQLTANGRTLMTEFRAGKSEQLVRDLGRRRFLTMFAVHLMSHKILNDKKAEGLWLDIDTVGVEVKSMEPPKDGSPLFYYITDEFNLLLRVESENDILKHHSLRAHRQLVLAFCDLRLLPFDFENNCAVARFCETSSLRKVDPRVEELRCWSASPDGHRSLRRLSAYLETKLTRSPCRDSSSAVGYIVGIRKGSSERLHIEVDCGAATVEEWELPICLLKGILPIASENQEVALLPSEEQRLAALGNVRCFARAKGVLWQFHLARKKNNLESDTMCDRVVRSISLADTRSLGRLYSAW
eukprot:scaffold7755_cov104-Cylindrotheca_fusiformis.AAC.6